MNCTPRQKEKAKDSREVSDIETKIVITYLDKPSLINDQFKKFE